jgi:hypothetical protein
VHSQIQGVRDVFVILSLLNKAIIVSEAPSHDLFSLLKSELVDTLDYLYHAVEYPVTHYLYSCRTVIFPLSLDGNFSINGLEKIS